MQNFIDMGTIVIISKLGVAILCGMIIGLERVWAHKTAGMRTYALVSMGSALFVIISETMLSTYTNYPGINPFHIVAQIVVGVGFLGTGLIFSHDSKVMGMTTATSLWVSAGIGMAAGFGLFGMAFIATFLTLFIFVALYVIEARLKKTKFFKEDNENSSMTNN